MLQTTETKITFSNDLELPYNPYVFNRDSVIAYSIQRGDWTLTEELLLRLIPFLNVTEVNFAGKTQIVVKTAENFYVEIKFTEKKITSVRVIQFFKCKTQGFELVTYKTMRGYLSCDELPVSIEERVSIPLSQLEIELGALISVMLTKFYGFKFEMLLD
jgi:hypothetical protein